jgi:hypothetical protein
MNAKEIIEKLRIQFNELVKNADVVPPTTPSAIPEPVKMAIAKLKDGTEVEVTELEIGGIVTIQGVPAPIGEHELEDGTIIVLGDNGVITEIKVMTDAGYKPKEDEMSAKFSAFETSTK